MVSNANELLPDPLGPVMTTNWLWGISTSTWRRLCTRTPRRRRHSWPGSHGGAVAAPGLLVARGNVSLVRIMEWLAAGRGTGSWLQPALSAAKCAVAARCPPERAKPTGKRAKPAGPATLHNTGGFGRQPQRRRPCGRGPVVTVLKSYANQPATGTASRATQPHRAGMMGSHLPRSRQASHP